MSEKQIQKAYELAKDKYAQIGVDTDKAVNMLSDIPVSLHCWQGDDVGGFEQAGAELSGGGIQATGNYPGKARNLDELRGDLEMALSLLPGKYKVNLHASYLDNGGKFIDRDQVTIEHFQSWVDWAGENDLGIDFNPTFFSHPKASDGLTLSHPDKNIRKFWIEHGKACRQIALEMGKALGKTCVVNFWMPDGQKDTPVDRKGPRKLIAESLDEIFSDELDEKFELDSLESKLFGIGAESYTVCSHEVCLCYAVARNKLLCLDAGHFHPTEVISDKISAVLDYVPGLLLHVSRPVRWDSDHVVILDDELRAIAQQIIRCGEPEKIHIGLDFFDASINRLAAWVIGTRSMRKALLLALLEPTQKLKELEISMDYTNRLAMLEELKMFPANAVWDYYCMQADVPTGLDWLDEVKKYEKEVLAAR